MRFSSTRSSNWMQSTHKDDNKDNGDYDEEESLIYYQEHGNTPNDGNEWNVFSSLATVKDDDNDIPNKKNVNDHTRAQHVRRNKRKAPSRRMVIGGEEYSQQQKLQGSNDVEEEENIFASLQRELCLNVYDSDDNDSRSEINEKSKKSMVPSPKKVSNTLKPLLLSPLQDDDSGPDNHDDSDHDNEFWNSNHLNKESKSNNQQAIYSQNVETSPSRVEKQQSQHKKRQDEPQSLLQDRRGNNMENIPNLHVQDGANENNSIHPMHMVRDNNNFSSLNNDAYNYRPTHEKTGKSNNITNIEQNHDIKNNERDELHLDTIHNNTGQMLEDSNDRGDDWLIKRSNHTINHNSNDGANDLGNEEQYPSLDLGNSTKNRNISNGMPIESAKSIMTTVSGQHIHLPLSSPTITNSTVLNKARTMAAIKKKTGFSSLTQSIKKNNHNKKRSSFHLYPLSSQLTPQVTIKTTSKHRNNINTETSFLDHSYQSSPSSQKQFCQRNDTKNQKFIKSTSLSIVGSRPAHWDQKRKRNNTVTTSITTASKAKLLSQATKTRSSIMKSKARRKQSLTSSKQDNHKIWQQNVKRSDITFGPAFRNNSKIDNVARIVDDVDVDQEEPEGTYENNNNTQILLNSPNRLTSSLNFNNGNSMIPSTPQHHIQTRNCNSHDVAARSSNLWNESHNTSPYIYSTTLSPTNLWPTATISTRSRKKKTSNATGSLVSKWKSLCRQMEGDEIRLQSKSYPFSINRSNRNDPRNRMDTFIDVTIVGNSTTISATLSCVLGYIHSFSKTTKSQNDADASFSSDVHNSWEKHDLSQEFTTSIANITSDEKCNFQQLSSKYSWLVFAIDTIRKQSIAPNAQLRVYDTIIISQTFLSENNCAQPVDANVTGSGDHQNYPRAVVLCTRLCEPYPKMLSPLPKLAFKAEKN